MLCVLLLVSSLAFAGSSCEKLLPKAELPQYKKWKTAKRACLPGHGIPEKLLKSLNYESVFFPMDAKACPLKRYFADSKATVVCSETRVVYHDGKFVEDFPAELNKEFATYNQSAPTVK